jgi:hypothetical protein
MAPLLFTNHPPSEKNTSKSGEDTDKDKPTDKDEQIVTKKK